MKKGLKNIVNNLREIADKLDKAVEEKDVDIINEEQDLERLKDMGNINIKGSKLGNGTVIIGGNIKNSSIEGNSVSIINNKIFVDGKEIETEEKVINIIVEGNLDKLEVDCCNSIKVNGVTKDIEVSNGNIAISGDVKGNVNNVNGNIIAKVINGNCKTTNGDILCNDQKKQRRKMDKTDVWFEEKVLKLKTKLVIYRNVLGNKNIVDHDLIGIILELIYSNIIKIDEFLGISKKTIEYKNKNIRYLDELEKELENIYETLTGDTKKKEAFRKNLLNWVKKYVEDLNNRKKKTTNSVEKERFKEHYYELMN